MGIDLYAEVPHSYEDPEARLAIHIRQGYQHGRDTVQKYLLRYRSGELRGYLGRISDSAAVKAMYMNCSNSIPPCRLPQLAKLSESDRVGFGCCDRPSRRIRRGWLVLQGAEGGDDRVFCPTTKVRRS